MLIIAAGLVMLHEIVRVNNETFLHKFTYKNLSKIGQDAHMHGWSKTI